MTGSARFRALACSLAGATEGTHMGVADFRVGGRIFATLAYEQRGLGTLKFSPDQQAAVLADAADYFEPATGGWGRMGMTLIRLDAPEDVLRDALQMAYRRVAEGSSKPRGSRAGKNRIGKKEVS